MLLELERYIELTFRLNKHFPALVDSYFGPPHIKRRINDEKRQPLKNLFEEANKVLEDLKTSGLDELTKDYLEDQVKSLIVFIKQNISPELSHKEYASKVLQINIETVEDRVVKQKEDKVKTLLSDFGFKEELYSSIHKFFRGELVIGNELVKLFSQKIPHYRGLTKKLFKLPKGETVEVKRYSGDITAYVNYKGNFHTVVKLNTRVKKSKWAIEHLVAHETYPGHHTHYSLREEASQQSPLANFFLFYTPEGTIVEGLSEWAYKFISDDNKTLRNEIFEAINDWRTDVENNAALLYYNQNKSRKVVEKYLLEAGCYSKEEIRNFFTFITAKFFDVYCFTYKYGYELIKSLYEKSVKNGTEDKFLNFLYKKQITPNLLKKQFTDKKF